MEKISKKEEYNIGLDIGTTSIGWAVTDLNNNIIKRNSKNMWGVRLFNEGQTAEGKRMYRSTRRRLNRRKQRIEILQTILSHEIEKIDKEFYLKLSESSLVEEDKKIQGKVTSKKYNLFKELEMNDAKYFGEYPTIYHLREKLILSKEKVDIRLVYLALHHILKYRGNFLYEGQEFKDGISNIYESIEKILAYIEEENIEFKGEKNVLKENIVKILKNKKTKKKEKIDEFMECFEYDSNTKNKLKNIISAILGYKFSLVSIFELEDSEKDKISFTDDIDESEIETILIDKYNIYESLHAIYSWYILQEILSGEEFISKAFVNKYNKYSEDLKILKKVYKTFGVQEYNKMFRNKSGTIKNYQMYDEKVSSCTKDEIYKTIKDRLEKIKDKDKDIQYILDEIQNSTFLSKINTTDNGAIPYQLHYKELEKILENQGEFYQVIKENKEKILDTMKFKIPYYVGPLNPNSKYAWIKRKTDTKIYPWNFNEIVNKDDSAEAFIKRMTNTCTYIYNEPVIPKNSLLYSEYCMLNELNNIRINDKFLDKTTKQQLITNLFEKRRKVTVKAFKEYLINNQYYIEIGKISGLQDEKGFITLMNSYVDMNNIFGQITSENKKMIEKIIEWITLFEDKDILEHKINETYKTNISKEQLRKIMKLRYTGWSRLSRQLLNGIKSYDNETIMEKLRNTNFNFMQIINKKEFGFDKKIEETMPKLEKDKISYDDIKEIPGSPALKRGIWQTMLVVKEIVKIKGYDPKNIYIEFARGEEKRKSKKDSRILKLNKIYENIEKDIYNFKQYDEKVYKELKNKSKEKEFSEKLYLYFIQNGRSLYSGKPLDIDLLSESCEVDHILPQSYIKDDSISNKALVLREENQYKKDNLILTDDVIRNNREWWNELYKNGLIDAKKLHNLTRTSISEDEEIKFINRQLVETRQITKYVTNLLIKQYANTSVFSINANFTHNFRSLYKFYKNRNINNYHHAQDAYIVSVVGNFIDKHFKISKNEYVYADYIKKYRNQEKEKRRKNEYGIVLGIFDEKWKEENTKQKVEKIMNYKDCFVCKKLEEQTGEFYGQTLVGKDKAPKIKIKDNLPTEKYGGHTGEQKAYYSIIKYVNSKGKEEFELIGIPIQIAYLIKNKQKTLEQYLEEKGYTDCKIIKEKILKYQSFYNEFNEKMMFVSDSEIKMNKQLIISNKYQSLIYLMNKQKLEEDIIEQIESKFIDIFDYLLEKMKFEYKTLNNEYVKIIKKREEFKELDFEQKRKTINGIIDLMSMGQGNLSAIKLSDRIGRKLKVNLKNDKLSKIIFINESVTGMYKEEIPIKNLLK